SWGGMFKNWIVVWIGNLVGALLIVFLLYMSNLQGMNGGAVGDQFVSVAAGKVTLAPATLFFKGIMCNIFVCLAVWIGFAAKNVADKVIGILLPISAFVAMGFEHCVANMFFLNMGLACKAGGFGASVAAAASLNVGSVCYNLALATLGNIVGGVIFVGLAYWYVYHKPVAAK
ncbi:MAG: formate/nitrite transporter family protein, partial [Coriobacteriia bacterium]|nr:formate/nitrite transporter family protein [Coriobacteriia bacterium]